MIVLQFHPENAFGGFKDSAFDFKFFFAQVLLREKIRILCLQKNIITISCRSCKPDDAVSLRIVPP
jgi:hypothetical protein